MKKIVTMLVMSLCLLSILPMTVSAQATDSTGLGSLISGLGEAIATTFNSLEKQNLTLPID